MTSFHRDILLKSIWMSSARHDAWISSSCSMVRAGATITMGDGSVFVGRRWGKTRNLKLWRGSRVAADATSHKAGSPET